MTDLHHLPVLSSTGPAFFHFRDLGDRVVVTGISGSWVILERKEFEAFTTGAVAPGSELESRLRASNLLQDGFDAVRAGQHGARRRGFLHHGPNLHIFVLTLRCNETCVYCHASRATMDETHTDMSVETAERSVDLALSTTSPSVTIEFQGGEPLLCFDLLQHVVRYAIERNGSPASESARKELEFTLVTNLAAMDDEKLEWLLEHRVQICTSIDGPRDLHDAQRKLPGASAFDEAARWIRRINDAYTSMGLDPHVYRVEALVTTTRATLSRWKEVIDTYVELGCKAIFLRPIDPYGFVAKTGHLVGHTSEEFLELYGHAVDYIIELELGGTEILERHACIFLTKILGEIDPGYLDICNPCGAGIGQVAYGYDGKIFTCDEGRMLHEDGDDTFLIGDVSSSYRDLMRHPTVRTTAIASNLDAQPSCASCAYHPYCGVCPVHNHRTQGSLFGRMPESSWCAVHMGIQDYLFKKLSDADPATREVLERWTRGRPRTHFIQPGL